jgi:hypothetical protein
MTDSTWTDENESTADVSITVLKQDRVIMALMNPAFKTITDALRSEGVSMPTFNRWKNQDPGFVRRYREMRESVWEVGKTRLSSVAAKAVDTLMECMSSQGASWASKVNAASVALMYSDKLIDNQRLEARIEKMERDLADAASAGEEA